MLYNTKTILIIRDGQVISKQTEILSPADVDRDTFLEKAFRAVYGKSYGEYAKDLVKRIEQDSKDKES